MITIPELLRKRAAASPAPWSGFNLVHHERGGPLTATEIGEYVRKCVLVNDDAHFYVVVVEKPEGSADVCHVGNGPTSAANTDFICAAHDTAALAVALACALKEAVLQSGKQGLTIPVAVGTLNEAWPGWQEEQEA